MTRSRFTANVIALTLVLAELPQIHAHAQPSVQTQPMGSSETTQASPVPRQRSFDRYDVGAAAANVLWVPVKAGDCAISAGVGALAFIVTLGAVRGWTESAFDEGCIQKWLLTGADFRPTPIVDGAGLSTAHD